MSLPPEISKQNFEGLARAHAQNISGARQHDDKEKIYHKILLLRPKATNLNFFTVVVFCCYLLPQQKMLPKCCPTLNKHFLLRKFFSKSVSNVSKSKNVILVTRGGVMLGPPMYLHHMFFFI